MTILVTGFGPFPGVPVNPTEALVGALAGLFPRHVEPLALPTEWAVLPHLPALAASVPAVVMFGVAARRRRISYERLAWPAADDALDAEGKRPTAAPRHSRRTALPVARLAAQARAAGHNVTVSSDPGRYLCNAGYAAALSGNPRTLFVHVPMPGRGGLMPLVEHGAFLLEAIGLGNPRLTP